MGLDLFKFRVTFEVKNVSEMVFWYDSWYGEQFLKHQVPDLFWMAHVRDAIG